uniref:Uncharacterized protein n=1 Tax=Anopheles melas TaxID=34690 RepID=A0A182U2X7_9DIPT
MVYSGVPGLRKKTRSVEPTTPQQPKRKTGIGYTGAPKIHQPKAPTGRVQWKAFDDGGVRVYECGFRGSPGQTLPGMYTFAPEVFHMSAAPVSLPCELSLLFFLLCFLLSFCSLSRMALCLLLIKLFPRRYAPCIDMPHTHTGARLRSDHCPVNPWR